MEARSRGTCGAPLTHRRDSGPRILVSSRFPGRTDVRSDRTETAIVAPGQLTGEPSGSGVGRLEAASPWVLTGRHAQRRGNSLLIDGGGSEERRRAESDPLCGLTGLVPAAVAEGNAQVDGLLDRFPALPAAIDRQASPPGRTRSARTWTGPSHDLLRAPLPAVPRAVRMMPRNHRA